MRRGTRGKVEEEQGLIARVDEAVPSLGRFGYAQSQLRLQHLCRHQWVWQGRQLDLVELLVERLRRDFEGRALEQLGLTAVDSVAGVFVRLQKRCFQLLVHLVADLVTEDVRECPIRKTLAQLGLLYVTSQLLTSMRYSIARSGLLYAARSARMTCSRSNPIAIISLTALCKADPVTKAGSLDTAVTGVAEASVEAVLSDEATAAAGAASVAGAAAGTEGAAGVSVTAAV